MRDTEGKRENSTVSLSEWWHLPPHLITRGGWRLISTGCLGSSGGGRGMPLKTLPSHQINFSEDNFPSRSFSSWALQLANAKGINQWVLPWTREHAPLVSEFEGCGGRSAFMENKGLLCPFAFESFYFEISNIRGRYCIFYCIEVGQRLNG